MNDRPLRLLGVSHSFATMQVLDDIRLEVLRNEFLAVVGPSGCGKTTLLNLLSGSIAPTAGQVFRMGRTRMVYQQDGLLPWLTVRENICLGLRDIRDPAQQQRDVQEMLELVQMTGHQEHYPHQLSGGLRQKVELARALAGESELLLLDEPFSALDYITRLRMRSELACLLRQRPRTAVLVTHDLEEAVQLADRVVVLAGRPARISFERSLQGRTPRDLTDPQVMSAVRDLLSELGLTETAPERRPCHRLRMAR